jgi:hypothetical protein
MKVSCLLFLIFLVLSGVDSPTWSQDEKFSSGTRDSIKSIKRVLRSSGWSIPERSVKPFGEPRGIEIDGVVVQIEAFHPKDELSKFEEYYSPSAGELRIISGDYKIGTIFVYSVDGKQFAVQVSYSPVVIKKSRVEASTASITILYIDGNGDGLFEERIQTTAHPSLPKWLL